MQGIDRQACVVDGTRITVGDQSADDFGGAKVTMIRQIGKQFNGPFVVNIRIQWDNREYSTMTTFAEEVV